MKKGDFIELMEDAIRKLKTIPAVVKQSGAILAVGDIHGDLNSMKYAIDLAEELPVDHTFFIGDYVDRGTHQIEVLHEICQQLTSNTQVTFLRGNHEDFSVCRRYGFVRELMNHNLDDQEDLIADFFAGLPVFGHLASKAILAHGGIPANIDFDISEVQKPGREVKPENAVFGALWNDPLEAQYEPIDTDEYFLPNSRGPNIRCYSEAAVRKVCDQNDARVLIRAHIALREGYRQYNEVVHSVFSSQSGDYQGFSPKYLYFKDINDFEVLTPK